MLTFTVCVYTNQCTIVAKALTLIDMISKYAILLDLAQSLEYMKLDWVIDHPSTVAVETAIHMYY